MVNVPGVDAVVSDPLVVHDTVAPDGIVIP
jgi:hypothetical protein